MTYKESITAAQDELAKDPDVLWLSYGITKGKASGTLKNVPDDRLIETPIAENLMAGLAIGLSLRGKKPVVFIERADFLLNAMDAIVNHLAKIELMSRGQFKPAALFLLVEGNKEKPLFTGETHTQSFYEGFKSMVNERTKQSFACLRLVAQDPPEYIAGVFNLAHRGLASGKSTALWISKDAC